MNQIKIQDNTIRDGIQQAGINKGFNTIISCLNEINKLNLDSVEVGMCVTDFDFHIMKKKISYLNQNTKAIILTRLNRLDILQVVRLRELFDNVVVKLLIPVSDLHIEKKLNKNKQEYIKELIDIQKYCADHRLDVDACLEDATRADINYLFDVLDVCDFFKK